MLNIMTMALNKLHHKFPLSFLPPVFLPGQLGQPVKILRKPRRYWLLAVPVSRDKRLFCRDTPGHLARFAPDPVPVQEPKPVPAGP